MSGAHPGYKSAQRPVAGSRFAFYVKALSILDRHPAPSFSSSELPIDPGMSRYEKRHAEHWNGFVRFARDTIRKEEVHKLEVAGMLQPGQDILSSAQSEIVERLTDNTLRDMDALTGDGPGIARFSCPDRVMLGEWLLTPKRSATRAVASLNIGISHRSGGESAGLTRHHIRWAWMRYCADPFVRTRRGNGLALTIILNQHRALQWLRWQAERSIHFPGLSGAELATAVDRRCYLPFLMGETGLPFIDLTERAA